MGANRFGIVYYSKAWDPRLDLLDLTFGERPRLGCSLVRFVVWGDHEGVVQYMALRVYGLYLWCNRVTTSGTLGGSADLLSGSISTGPVPSLRFEMLVSVRRIDLGLSRVSKQVWSCIQFNISH